jgi:hypothetical protein
MKSTIPSVAAAIILAGFMSASFSAAGDAIESALNSAISEKVVLKYVPEESTARTRPDVAVASMNASEAVSRAFMDAEDHVRPLSRRSCVVSVVSDLLSAEHENRPDRRIRPYIDAAFDAGEEYSVDPYLLVAVGYHESRLRSVLGDEGRACGAWQYHPRYHPDVVDGGRDLDQTCDRLMTDLDYAAETTARRLRRYNHVCHYNQGGRCLREDLDNEPQSYSAGVYRRLEALEDACGPIGC